MLSVRYPGLLCLMLAGYAACAQECGTLQSLFDGHSSAGWQEVTGAAFPVRAWEIGDGMLRTIPSEDGVQDIRTVRSFRSFELVWEWKVSPGANSGVKYFIRKVDRWASRNGKGYQARGRGAEYQIADDEGDRDAASSPSKSAGSLYGKIAPAGKNHHPAGEWNESRIVVNGGQVEHWLNGDRVLTYHEDSPVETPIVLQNHNSVVWFRGIRIRQLCGAAGR